MKRYLIPKFFASALIILLIFVSSNVISQEKKRNKNVENTQHSPKKATLYALVPGLGQIYNRKYWKLPIVYAGFAATGYFGVTNRTEYLKFNEAYICLENEGDECTNDLAQKYTSDQLSSYRDYYRRNMELSFIIMGAWYILQILDASVDAHLYNWEVNENLNVDIQPVISPNIPLQNIPTMNTGYTGIKVRFKF